MVCIATFSTKVYSFKEKITQLEKIYDPQSVLKALDTDVTG